MVRILKLDELPQALLDERADAEARLKEVNGKLEAFIFEAAGIKVGDVVEGPYSGLRYRVTSAHAHVSRFGSGVTLVGHRLYKTSRRANREARSESHISDRCEKVEAEHVE